MLVQLIQYECVNNDTSLVFILPFTLFGSLLHSREVSSATFVQLRRHFIYRVLFQGPTWALGRSRAGGRFERRPVGINFCPLESQAWGC